MSSSKEEEEAVVPNIDPTTLTQLVEYATSFSAANGLQVEVPTSTNNNKNKNSYITAPISLLPQSYPLDQFAHAKSLAGPFNELVDRISRDGNFLKETLRDVRGVDEYTGKLLDLYEEIYLGENKGMEWGKHARSADRLGILRSDYMLHQSDKKEEGEYSLKQVELNTIASSFAGLASTVAKLHGFLTKRMESELHQFLGENERAVMGNVDAPSSSGDGGDSGGLERGVPQSPAMTHLPAAMAVAYNRYREQFMAKSDSSSSSSATTQPIVMFVVQPNETNTVDQRLLEFALWNNHQIPVVRMSLAEIHEKVVLDEESGRLTFNNGSGTKQEVAVVYFRAGYAPTDYPSGYDTSTENGSGIEWLARERLERGCATKCPNLGYHLAGTKKVQQELARSGVVEHFFPEEEEGGGGNKAAQIRTAFAGLYSLGADANEQDMQAVKEVLFNGGEGQYVLKPQREGGGYNYYGKDLADKLNMNCTITDDEEGNVGGGKNVELSPTLSEFILMERLFPPQQRAILLRNGQVEGTGMSISELGCFGTIVASGGEEGGVVHNEYGGFLLRTKFSGVDEGGVASGFATLSSPYLC
ncbi:hypothetical protein ACHAXR_011476 [Thalassiosira sp. AJA248-18]